MVVAGAMRAVMCLNPTGGSRRRCRTHSEERRVDRESVERAWRPAPRQSLDSRGTDCWPGEPGRLGGERGGQAHRGTGSGRTTPAHHGPGRAVAESKPGDRRGTIGREGSSSAGAAVPFSPADAAEPLAPRGTRGRKGPPRRREAPAPSAERRVSSLLDEIQDPGGDGARPPSAIRASNWNGLSEASNSPEWHCRPTTYCCQPGRRRRLRRGERFDDPAACDLEQRNYRGRKLVAGCVMLQLAAVDAWREGV